MRIRIKGENVVIEGELGEAVTMTIEQLFEMVTQLNVVFREDGSSVFETVEFTV